MIKGIGFKYEKFNFPCGELQVNVHSFVPFSPVNIEFQYEKNEEIIELLLLCDALKRNNLFLSQLVLPYVPYGRQDRVNRPGEALSIKVFTELLNLCDAEEVLISDPHSDVTPALINNCRIQSQEEIFAKLFTNLNIYLISPDGGALKKIYKLAGVVPCKGVIECSKKRNTSNGEITGVHVPLEDFSGHDCYIVDDICDGGRTFVELAKELKKRNCGKIVLMVTHGFFTKGLEVFDNLIDEIYTRNGRVK